MPDCQQLQVMDKKNAAKVTSLMASVLLVCMALFNHVSDWKTVGLSSGCGIECRMLYPFYHAGILHALLNVWCMLSIVFIYNVSMWRLLIAYFIAVTIPDFCISAVPTVGLSGVIFALYGSISFEVSRKTYFQLWMVTYLALGFMFPNTNAWLHLYCYLTGLMVALVNKPVRSWHHGR